MTTYDDLHWDSLDFVKKHLYRQLATPLNHALGRLAIVEHAGGGELSQEQYRRTAHSLETALNLLQAWVVLVHVKTGGTIPPDQRRPLAPGALPRWLVDHLKAQTALLVEHTQPVHVHPETFFQSLLLICDVGAAIGTLKHLVIANANHGRTGVWVRAVFTPPPTGPYKGLSAVQHHLQTGSAAEQDAATQLQVLLDLLALNGAALKVQNNTETGDQALAALLPVYDEALEDQPQAVRDSLYDHLARELGRTPASQEVVQDKDALSEFDEPSANSKPRLAKPMLAPASQAVSDAAETGLAARQQAVLDEDDEDAQDQPADDAADEVGADEIEVVTIENLPETLKVPPPDFRRRLVRPKPAPEKTAPAATAPTTDAPSPDAVADDAPGRAPDPSADAPQEPSAATESDTGAGPPVDDSPDTPAHQDS